VCFCAFVCDTYTHQKGQDEEIQLIASMCVCVYVCVTFVCVCVCVCHRERAREKVTERERERERDRERYTHAQTRRGGMNDEIRLLVDDSNVLILQQHIHSYVFGQNRRRDRRRQLDYLNLCTYMYICT